MATKTKRTVKKKNPSQAELVNKAKLHAEITAFIIFAVGVLLFLALFLSSAGKLGEIFKNVLLGMFGIVGYVLPFILIFVSIVIFLRRLPEKTFRPIILIILILLMLNLITAGFHLGPQNDPLEGMSLVEVFLASAHGESGGVIGMYFGWCMIKLLGKAGLFIFGFVFLIVFLLLLINTPLSPYIESMRDREKSRKERRMREKEAYYEYLNANKPEQPEEPETPSFSDDIDLEAEQISKQVKRGRFKKKEEDLSSKQKKILEAVQNDEDHVQGFSEPPITTGLNEEYTTSNVGYGLDPVNKSMPGIGLGDDYNESYKSSEQLPQAKSEPTISTDTVDDSFIDEPFTMEDLDEDVSTNDEPPTIAEKKEVPPVVPPKSEFKSSYNIDEKIAKYKLPPIDLLNKSPKKAEVNMKELDFAKAKLEQTLNEFNVQATVTNAVVGPTVTRYEVEPSVGVKISSIKSLEKDLALRLEVASVRVVAMPGKAVVGIEAYNKKRSTITIRDIIDSPEFRTMDSMLGFALGMDISGKKIITNLAEMPHLLIAGTTGSGKSVCLNSIIISILYRAKPNEVKFILIDPKQVEMPVYNGISHLLLPVVTDPEKAAVALGYAVSLMEERYKKFAELGVRNLEGYNSKVIQDQLEDEVYPQVVIVIDELYDLMMTAPAKVQEYISRLAAKARAAGIHLVVATQQPLSKILTSVIKANIPSRIALSVADNSASRVILDEPGAETLIGKGDMLFKSVSMREPIRVQGPWISQSEVFKVTEYIKKQIDSDYSPDILEFVNEKPTGQLVEDEDEFFKDAVAMVVQAKQASVSMIQRRFRIGYNRAARLVDMMEEMGIVASSDGTNKARKVLMSKEQLPAFLSEGNSDLDDIDSVDSTDDSISNLDDDEPSTIADDDDLPPFNLNDD